MTKTRDNSGQTLQPTAGGAAALIPLFRRRAPIAVVIFTAFVSTTLLPATVLAGDDPPPPAAPGLQESSEEMQDAVRERAVAAETQLPDVGDAEEDPFARPSLEGATVDPDALENLSLPDSSAPPDDLMAVSLPSGEDKSGVTSKTISVPKGSGTIKGMEESFSAQLSTGIATYSVPFALLAARGGAQPSLGLSYSSSGGFGSAGVGWNVGAPFIARQTDRGIPNYNEARDGSGNLEKFDLNMDRFVFNGGQELVPICLVGGDGSCPGAQSADYSGYDAEAGSYDETMPSWSAGWVYYRPRVEGSFLRFFWSPSGNTWKVQSKSGVTMELGVPEDARGYQEGLERNPEEPSEIYRWCLTRQYDTYKDSQSGDPVNAVYYQYDQREGTAYLTDIYDTSPTSDPAGTDFGGFAHHTKLHWDVRTDPTNSYRSGWRMEQNWRLARVDVTSANWEATGSRELVRRYELSYDPGYHQSLLASVQVRGRCSDGAAVAESGDALPDSLGCSTTDLPPMSFGYSHVEGDQQLDGYEHISGELRNLDNSPPHSVDEQYTDLFDINSDSLPDLLVTAPGFYGNGHAVFLNGEGGQIEHFGDDTLVEILGVNGANSGTITLKNANVVPLDLDADGRVNLLHMPKVKNYSVYGIEEKGDHYAWVGRAIASASGQSPKIDFGNDSLDTKVMDVNFDGLVDVVVSTGLEFQTFFSQGRLPGGDGQFGTGEWASTFDTSTLTTEPVKTCVPWSGEPVRFSNPDIKLSDMNGDGIVDIVRLRRGQIQYWPGRGNGYWGTGRRDDCPAGSFGDNTYIAMDASPYYSDIEGTTMRLDDVNGDGLTDLVQVRFDEVDVYLNIDGRSWTDRHIIEGTPASPNYANRVRLVDVDGSGTRDILWGNAGKYRYIDLQAGTRPWVLTQVNNGLGKVTELEYTTSVDEMLAAENSGKPWASKVPMVMHLVKRMIEHEWVHDDGSPIMPAELGNRVYTTEYSYRDPFYDGQQREFRGFAEATSTRIGDVNSPTSHSRSEFLLGQCADDPATGVDECSPGERWRDNPREALKGLPVISETFDDQGMFTGTSHTQYTVRRLYQGLDGRGVYHAFASASRSQAYDTGSPNNFPAFADDPPREIEDTVVFEEAVGGGAPVEQSRETYGVPQRAPAGMAVTRSSSLVDTFGNKVRALSLGCTSGSGCPQTDEPLTSFTIPVVVDEETGGWLWRTELSWAEGDASIPFHGPRNRTLTDYTGEGDPAQVTVTITGTEALQRCRVPVGLPDDACGGSPGTDFADTPSGALDPATPTISYVSAETSYDAYGNSLIAVANGERCGTVAYESSFAQLPTVETAYPAGCPGGAPSGAGLTTSADQYDRGFGLVTQVTDMQGQVSHAAYDGLGRITELTQPSDNPSGPPGTNIPPPSVRIAYYLPDTTGSPYSVIHTQAQDGAYIENATDDDYINSIAYVDGFGRTLFTLGEADTNAGDGGNWVVSGYLSYDTKGTVERKWLEFFYSSSGDPLVGALDEVSAALQSVPYGRQRYDAFGRQQETYDLDGTITLRSRYHALSSDAWDAADIYSGPHQGSYATAIKDGHGRGLQTIERFRDGNTMVERYTTTTYLPTGEPETIIRSRSGSPDSVKRWLRYDSLGRMVLNVEPNTSDNFTADETTANTDNIKAWRYGYNRHGELVGTSDARGCGVNFAYDAVGRLLTEDYSPCEHDHPAYSVPSTGTFDTASGAEVLYVYDAKPTSTLGRVPTVTVGGNPIGYDDLNPSEDFLKGRLVAVLDRASETWTVYDGRGRTTGTFTRVAKPGVPSDTLSDRYAPRWYGAGAEYDAADRVVDDAVVVQSAEFGATENLIKVKPEYSARGVVKSVTSNYGTLIDHVTRRADGLHTEITYGDAALTTTSFTYDERRRARTVQTYRAEPSSWSTPPPDYLPAPAPGGTDTTFQLLLQDDEFTYDVVNNPVEIRDWRNPGEWPAGAKPVHRKMQYDDLYRVSRIDYEYALGDDAVVDPGAADTWTDPFAAEAAAAGTGDKRRADPAPHQVFDKRIKHQSFRYDWLGNNKQTDDDQKGFYDRSLGTIENGPTEGAAYQLTGASQATGSHSGNLKASYDVTGNLTEMRLNRPGACEPSDSCNQLYRYRWDEVGRLVTARRWDYTAAISLNAELTPTATPEVELHYGYDAGDMRVIKRAVDPAQNESHTLYIFPGYELRRADFTAGDYTADENTEVPYLFANGVRLARVVYEKPTVGEPQIANDGVHVFFELGDHLGSDSVVLDKATGELVERSTYQAYGGVESDYRPGRWQGFREDYRFTGKEEDVEVGLQYFGKRFLNPLLGRWMSADPLGVHGLGADLNVYAYVSGAALKNVDPLGLQDAAPAEDPENPTPMGMINGNPIVTQGDRNYVMPEDIILPGDPPEGMGPAIPFKGAPQARPETRSMATLRSIGGKTGVVNGVKSLVNSTVDLVGLATGASAFTPLPKFQLTRPEIGRNEFETAIIAQSENFYQKGTYYEISALTLVLPKLIRGPKGSTAGGGGKCFVAGTPILTERGSVAIERLRVGDRVLTSGLTSDRVLVDESWFVVELEMRHPHTSSDKFLVSMLRPPEWVTLFGAEPGRIITLSFEEMGIEGEAVVLALSSAPEVKAGLGRLVMSTLTHVNNNVHELRFLESSPPLHLTGVHRLFSQDRKGWVPAEELRVGEKLKTANGDVEVSSVATLRDAARVYNLQIDGEHEYYAGALAVLSHNDCPIPKLNRFLRNKMKRIRNQNAAGGMKGTPGSVTAEEATKLGKNWVGEGYRTGGDGYALISKDGLRQFRMPRGKPNAIDPVTGRPYAKSGVQANFEARPAPKGTWTDNVHLEVH